MHTLAGTSGVICSDSFIDDVRDDVDRVVLLWEVKILAFTLGNPLGRKLLLF